MDALMTNGFDVLGHTRVLQIHWLKRVCAFLIDAVLVLVPTWAVLIFLGVTESVTFGLVSGLVFFLYSAGAEGIAERTIGKAALRLRVRSQKGRVTTSQAFVRSIPKFFWYVFPAIDTLAALASEGDPRQRMSDRVLGTTVVQSHYLRVKVHRLDVKGTPKPPAKA